ncbi:uncharacterized protein BX663DRAFT_298120 [Cokeromyces recurvatus]|uniref:uncharacterized protein n=1 Tax=Cokeromyces recurvatus TaxID=90255 RepID=UPI0022206155|nr:uncharacterized protein BX663DRAFT_298120 [Cokeromyces recurvatus]KAI7897642.1 hypothetical protein BX663DRAFT_298120 [Cokeromyces recurvatus]
MMYIKKCNQNKSANKQMIPETDANNEEISINDEENDFEELAFSNNNDEENIKESNIPSADTPNQFFNINLVGALPAFIMIFINFFQNIAGLSDSSTKILLKFINAIFVLFQSSFIPPSKLSNIKAKINADFAIKVLQKYVVCPECNCIYAYEDIMNGLVSYFSNMVFKPYNTLKIKCYAPLITKDSNTVIKPIKRYTYNSIKTTRLLYKNSLCVQSL